VTHDANQTLSALLLDHIGKYRISFLKVMERIYGGEGDVSATVQSLVKRKLIKPLGKAEGFGSVLGSHVAYQLTKAGAAQAGITDKRTKKLNEITLGSSFRVLWLCCMGQDRFALLTEKHLLKLFESPLSVKNNAYCIEIAEKPRVYRIRPVSATSSDAYVLRATREDLQDCAEIPILKEFVEHGRYGNLLMASKPERCKRLEERINAQGLKNLGHVRVVQVPDLNQVKEVMRDR